MCELLAMSRKMERRWNEAEKRINELKEDREIIHQDCERWRMIAKEWKHRHDLISENAEVRHGGPEGNE